MKNQTKKAMKRYPLVVKVLGVLKEGLPVRASNPYIPSQYKLSPDTGKAVLSLPV